MSIKMIVFGIVGVVIGCAYFPDVFTRSNRDTVLTVVKAVGRAGTAVLNELAGSGRERSSDPTVAPGLIEAQTEAMLLATDFWEKMPSAISHEITKVNAKQMEDVNRRLLQQDEAIAEVAEISQATALALEKVVERLDKLDTTIHQLKGDRTEGATPRDDQGQSTTVPSLPGPPLVLRKAANP